MLKIYLFFLKKEKEIQNTALLFFGFQYSFCLNKHTVTWQWHVIAISVFPPQHGQETAFPAKNQALKLKVAIEFLNPLPRSPYFTALASSSSVFLLLYSSEMDVSEEVRAAHKREFADFLDQDVCN